MSRAVIRGMLLTVLLLSAGTLAISWQTAPSNASRYGVNQTVSSVTVTEPEQIGPLRDHITVITTDPPGSTNGAAAIVAVTPDGRTRYHNDTYGNYFDVDPDPPRSRTVLYVAGNRYEQCPATLTARSTKSFNNGCAEIAVERLNLSTGETERIHTAVTAWDIWHDVDRIDDERLLVADIAEDRVIILNTSTDEIEWEWRAEDDLAPDSGGQSDDWTHLNDVELLADGHIMVSLRNQDRVGFLAPGTGLEKNLTLGTEDAYGILYEQHNPDYIPEARGGPAVIVADSENNRVVEYQYTALNTNTPTGTGSRSGRGRMIDSAGLGMQIDCLTATHS